MDVGDGRFLVLRKRVGWNWIQSTRGGWSDVDGGMEIEKSGLERFG